jgi:hypothetical protein
MNLRISGLAVALAAFALACASTESQSRGTGAMSTGTEPGSGQGSQASAGQQGAAGGAAQDPLMEPGPQIKGHAEDRVVTGQLGEVSPHSVSIRSSQGTTTTLELVPETSIVVEGREGSYSDLQEGQPVRASYANVEGHDVAVEIHAGVGSSRGMGTGTSGEPSGEPSPGGPHGHMGGSTGSSGSMGEPSGSTGSMGEPSGTPPPLPPPDAAPAPQQ